MSVRIGVPFRRLRNLVKNEIKSPEIDQYTVRIVKYVCY